MSDGITITITGKPEFQEVKRAFEEVGNGFAELAARAQEFFVVLAEGFIFREFTRAAMESQRAFVQLGAVLSSTGHASAAFAEELEKTRKTLSESTGTKEDEIAVVQRLLLSYGAQAENLDKLTTLSLDYAAAMGTTGASAAEQLGRALGGQGIVLRGMRLEIDQTLPKAQQLQYLMEELTKRIGGQARASFEGVAPDVQRFNVQLHETEEAIGGVLLSDAVGPFLRGLGDGFKKIADEMQRFNANFPELATALRTFAGLAGEALGRLAPLIAGLTALTLAAQTLKLSLSALGPVLSAVRAALAGLAATNVGQVVLMVRSFQDLGPALSLIGAELGPIALAVAGVTAALWTGIEAWRAWHAARQARESAAAAAEADQDLRAKMIRTLDSATESGAMSPAAAGVFEDQINALDKAKLSAEGYHAALVKIARSLSELLRKPTQSEGGIADRLFAEKVAELNKQFQASSAAVSARSTLVALGVDQAINEAQYKRGEISLQQYLAKRRELIKAEAQEEQIPLHKAIEVATDELIKKKAQLDEADQAGDKNESTRLLAEYNKLKLEKEKAEGELLNARQNAKKRGEEQTTLEYDQPTTVGGGLRLGMTDTLKEFGSVGLQVAQAFKSVWESAIHSISSGITDLIMGTKTWGQAMAEIGRSLLTSFVQVMSEMVVRWTLTHVVMGTISSLFRTKETVETAAHTGTQVAIHSAGEGAKTTATATGASARGGIRVGETIFHGVQVAIRVAAHVAGEIAATAVTIAQVGIRLVAIMAETVVWLIKAGIEAMASVASVPYVGPILAIAALAAVLAAGGAAIAGKFEAGGRPPVGQASLVGERGPELFVPDRAGTILPAGETASMLRSRNGRGSSGSAGSGASEHSTTNLNVGVFHDQRMFEDWARSQEGRAVLVDVWKQHAHQVT